MLIRPESYTDFFDNLYRSRMIVFLAEGSIRTEFASNYLC